MFRTAARIAAVTAIALTVAPVTGASATITLENVMVSSAQPAPQPLKVTMEKVFVSSAR